MKSIRKHWRFAILLGLFVVGWLYLPTLTWELGSPAFWNSATGAALRPDLQRASTILLVAGVIGVSLLRIASMIAINRAFERIMTEDAIDVSREGRAIPERAVPAQAALTGLGFTRLGEAEGPMGIRRGEVTTHWLYSIDQGRVRASLTAWARTQMVTVVFLSDFDGGAAAATNYPLGPRIRRANLLTDASDKSIEEAYQLHLEHVQELVTAYGGAVHADSALTHLMLGAAYNQRHGKTLLDYLQNPNWLMLIAIPILGGAILGGMYLLPRVIGGHDLLTDVSFAALALIGGVLFVGISVIGGVRLWRVM